MSSFTPKWLDEKKKNKKGKLVFAFPNCRDGHQYALDIIDKKIPANIWIIGACKRYLKDIQRVEEDNSCPFYYRPEKAEKFLRLVQKFKHVKGKWTTATITYMPWQKFGFLNIMGFYSHETKERRFRTAHWDVGRGAGKSCVASQTVLYFLCLDDPVGNEVYCAASKKDQARLVLDSARSMARKNESYLKNTGTVVRAHEILHADSDSFVRALSSNHDSQDGLAALLIVADELHAMSKNMFNVLDSGQSKRRDSLLLCITTAGISTETAGYSQRAYAKKVALGEVDDDTFWSAVYAIDDEDEKTWWEEKHWIKANPGLYEINDITNLRAKAKKAMNSPVDKPNFLCKHLNLYQNSMHQFFNVNQWKANATNKDKIKDLYGKRCFAACDLSSKNDLTSFSYVFNEGGKYQIINQCFCPEDVVKESKNLNYQTYVDEGSLILTPGAAISYDILQEHLLEYNRLFSIQACHYDEWQANMFALEMMKKHIEMVIFKMSVANLSEATKTLEAYSRNNDLEHFGTEILSWMIGNVVCRYDAAQNVFPRKENNKNKIDGAISTIMALAGWINKSEEDSVYEERGFLIL